MTVAIITPDGTKVKGEDFGSNLQSLDDILQPGMPVMFKTVRTSRGVGMGDGRRATRYVFFSDGTLRSDGIFGIQKGKRNFAYAMVNETDPEKFSLTHHWNSQWDNIRVTEPRKWTGTQHSSGCFSPAGPTSWTSFHGSGTEEIVVGEQLGEKYGRVLQAVQFARDAFAFKLPGFYTRPNHLVMESGDTLRGREQDERSRLTDRIARVGAARNLLEVVADRVLEYSMGVHVKQVGYFHDSGEHIREMGYPTDPTDYLVCQLSHPSKVLGIVKPGPVVNAGTLILPWRGMDEVVKLACSDDMMREFYPSGAPSKES